MPIAPNTTFNHYEILALLGKGGMGEVYRARDTRLNREVAIKVLPSEVAYDTDRLRRFEQEAMATSALNHPNILTVYDFGNHEGNPYLVMELLEGEELRAQLKDGRVKILDFGLAKLTEARQGDGAMGRRGEEESTLALSPHRPIAHSPHTIPGTVMGTVAYMSPEQVRGQDLDHRSDIFSFGTILFEMLSGQRPFQHELMADVMSAITRDDPPELTNAKISPALDKIVRRCLEKKPEMRFHSAHDLGFALSTLTTPSGSRLETTTALPALTESSPVGNARWFGNARLAWLAAAVTVLVALAALPFAVKYLRQSPPAVPVAARFTIAAPEKATAIEAPELSPDGRHLVFVAVVEGRRSLWLRPLGSLTAQPLPGTEGVTGFPFWSPDSRSLGFTAGGELRKLDVAGGAPQTLCKLPSGGASIYGGSWNRNSVILFSDVAGIYHIPATGGEPMLALRSDQTAFLRWPVWLPDGRHFFFVRTPTQGVAEIHLAALDRQETTRLLAADSQARYANGHLLFARAGALRAAPFNADSLKLTGEPFVVADKVRVVGNARGYFSVSDNGSLAWDSNAFADNQQLTWLDRAGKPLGTVGPLGEYDYPRLAPDGKRVAVARIDPQSRSWDIYVIDFARGASSRLTFDPGDDRFPGWSPDGSRIAWRASRDGAFQFYQKLASGVGPEELLLKSDVVIGTASWSADGRFLLYSQNDPKTGQDLWMLPLAGDRQPALFLQTPFGEGGGRFSPDGRWIAYQSNDQGRNEVYVQTFPASGGKWQISTNGGSQSWWRSDGRELYYLSADGKLMAVEVKPGGSFEASAPRALFDLAPARALGGTSSYAVTAAGDRFLFVTAREEAASLQFTVVTNWTAEAKK